MSALTFDNPVYIPVGVGFPAEVGSVEHAYALLNDLPVWRRDSAHAVALNACRAALSGEIDAETARATLAAFARRNNADGETKIHLSHLHSTGAPFGSLSELHP
jgi:hypothetical protein